MGTVPGFHAEIPTTWPATIVGLVLICTVVILARVVWRHRAEIKDRWKANKPRR